MKISFWTLIILGFLINDMSGQIGRLSLSPLQITEQVIGVTDITITYSRPSKRGRKIFGALVPYDKLWRTGANRNTTIEFSETVIIDQQRIDPGKYAIFTIPSPESWKIIFYSDTDNWDIPEVVDSTKIVATTNVLVSASMNDREVLSITIGDFSNYTFDLHINWEKASIKLPIELTTKEIMNDRINNILEGPTYDDYYAAAVYQMESGKNYVKGLEWINKAIAVTDEVTWWDLRVKSIMLLELSKKEEALKLAKKGLEMAEKENRAYGISEFNIILGKLEN